MARYKDTGFDTVIDTETEGRFVNKTSPEFQEWLNEGNTPDPAEPPPVKTYEELRRAEYPPVGDQLDAIWKHLATQNPTGDAEVMLTMIYSVKTKYPKA